MPNTVNINSY